MSITTGTQPSIEALPGRREPRAGAQRMRRQESRLGVLLTLPAVVLLCLVTLIPVIGGLSLSLFSTHFLAIGDFVGTENYVSLFHNADFWNSCLRTVEFVGGSLLITVPVGLALALLLNEPARFLGIFRALILLPWVISQTVTAMLWLWLLDGNYGPIEAILSATPIGTVPFLSDPHLSMVFVILANAWNTYPLALALFLAALQNVSREQREAAVVDGAGRLQVFRYVVFPAISPTLLVVIILLSIDYLNAVTLIYTMTGGGPVGSTDVLAVSAYLQGFVHFRLDIAGSIAMVMVLLNVIFSVSYASAIRRQA